MEFGSETDSIKIEANEPSSFSLDGIDPDRLIEPYAMEGTFVEAALSEGFDPDRLIAPDVEFDGSDIKQTDVSAADKVSEERLSDVDEAELYSSKETRISQACISEGTWSGEPGNSDFTPNDEGVLKTMDKFGQSRVSYSDGVVNLSPFSKASVTIDISPDRATNRSSAYKTLASEWNELARGGRTDWTQRDVLEWRRAEGLEFHECSDLKTCQFIPADIHQTCKHTGGVHEAKSRDILNAVGGFDD